VRAGGVPWQLTTASCWRACFRTDQGLSCAAAEEQEAAAHAAQIATRAGDRGGPREYEGHWGSSCSLSDAPRSRTVKARCVRCKERNVTIFIRARLEREGIAPCLAV